MVKFDANQFLSRLFIAAEPAAVVRTAEKVEHAKESDDGRERDEWGFPLAAGERAMEWRRAS
jgi:hypothetical protein